MGGIPSADGLMDARKPSLSQISLLVCFRNRPHGWRKGSAFFIESQTTVIQRYQRVNTPGMRSLYCHED